MQLIGYDLGSSSVKASIIDVNTGKAIASAFHPKEEMTISAPEKGWAEQDPQSWWDSIKAVTHELLNQQGVEAKTIKAIGISYQMHGLVIVDKDQNVLRPSIIWCDSRAVATGEKAFESLGKEKCLDTLLNSPGNFTASKLKWVKDHEPETYEKIFRIMLPGDYIAMRMTGEFTTTPSGLSEGIFWDFKQHEVSQMLMEHYGFSPDYIPTIVENIGLQGTLNSHTASELGLEPGTPITYRAGDQPNNALSLNVFNPGEIAATAGTSGVVFGVSDQIRYDPLSRVNTFAHVNHTRQSNRLGVLLCINGTGILNAWLKRNCMSKDEGYEHMNQLAASVPPGSDGLKIIPFGNGAERITGNKDLGCTIEGLDFNRHTKAHLIRAAHEGIVHSFNYGMEIMQEAGIAPSVIRAGHSNMFLSPVFRESLASLSNTTIELYNTDGSQGAARAAGLGAGIYKTTHEAFAGLEHLITVEPNPAITEPLTKEYKKWKKILENKIK